MNNTEKRVDKIVKSMNPKELVLFYIAQALTFNSDEEWLSASDEYKDERSAETSRAHSAFITRINKRYLPIVATEKIRRRLVSESILTGTLKGCKLYVDDVIVKMLPRFELLFEILSRAISETHTLPSEYGGDLGQHLAGLLRTQQTMATIREEYFEGRPILFNEYCKRLGMLIDGAEDLAQLYNKLLDAIERAYGTIAASRIDVAKIKLDAKKNGDADARSLIALADLRTKAVFRP